MFFLKLWAKEMNIQDETIHALFEAHAARCPLSIAAIHNTEQITYAVLNQHATYFATYLQSLDVKPETPIALCMPRSIDLLIAMLGVLKAGCCYVPLDASQPKERLLQILVNSQAPFLMTSTQFKPIFSQYTGQILLTKTLRKTGPTQPLRATNPHQLAYIIYTSGSTGVPKGVLIEQGSLRRYASWFSHYSHLKPGDRIDFSANHGFDMAITTSVVALALGLTVVICDEQIKKDMGAYLDHLQHHHIHCIKITPTYFKELLHHLEHRHVALPHLQRVILGGEALRTVDCLNWLKHYPKHHLFNEYGPTETTVAVLVYEVSMENVHQFGVNVPIGFLTQTDPFYLLNESFMPVGPDEIGQLFIGGNALARGYLNQPELTLEKFKDNIPGIPYRCYGTGDFCRRLPDGSLDYLGRMDQQVKIRGFRIELGEIELCLREYSAIEDVVVLARDEHRTTPELVVYYVLHPDTPEPSAYDLSKFLRKTLPEHMIPTHFMRVDFFPLTENGKLDPSALPTPCFSRQTPFVAASSKLERELIKIWSEVLEVNNLGITDHFFEWGGHSLAAARMVSKIKHTLFKNIDLEMVYRAPTIIEFAKEVKKAPRIEPKQSSTTSPLTQHTRTLPLGDFQLLLWFSHVFDPRVKKLNIVARRHLHGALNLRALSQAFDALFKKHELFCYRIGSFHYTQSLQKKISFEIITHDISSMSMDSRETTLMTSFEELIHWRAWPAKKPLLKARLFCLDSHLHELQICMPHFVCDNVSVDLVFAELSYYYEAYQQEGPQNQPTPTLQAITPFKSYVLHEQQSLNMHLHRDLTYWTEHLHDAHFFHAPVQHVVHNMKDKPYSTYLKIPEEKLSTLKQWCATQQVHLVEALCAALGIALLNCSDQDSKSNQNLLFNLVRSTREDQTFDETIGCLLSIHPIKLAIKKASSLGELAKQVQQVVLQNRPYQQCSSLLKLACMNSDYCQNSWLKQRLFTFMMLLHASINRTSPLNPMLIQYLGRLATLDRRRGFLINVNIWNSFFSPPQTNTSPTFTTIPNHHQEEVAYDLSKLDYMLDVCFLRDEHSHIPYLVLSGNLNPDFRTQIGEKIIQMMHVEPVQADEMAIGARF